MESEEAWRAGRERRAQAADAPEPAAPATGDDKHAA
jgi:hypothetical protein